MAKKKTTLSRNADAATLSSIRWDEKDMSSITTSIWKTWQSIMAHSTENKIRVSLPVPPILNQRFGLAKSGRFYVVSEHKEYKSNVAKYFMCKRFSPFIGPVSLTVVWYRQRKSSDIDSRLKCLLDSLTGYAYLDDAPVEILLIVRSDADPKNPRVEVEIEELSLNVDGEIDSGIIKL